MNVAVAKQRFELMTMISSLLGTNLGKEGGARKVHVTLATSSQNQSGGPMSENELPLARCCYKERNLVRNVKS